MNSNGIKIHADSPCPDPHMLVRYQQGLLTPAEQHQLEVHLLDCELCEDALEGMQHMENPESLTNIREVLNEQIAQRVNKRDGAKIIHFPVFRIAAILVIVFISGVLIWYLQPEKSQEHLVIQDNTSTAEPSADPNQRASGSIPSNESQLSATIKSNEQRGNNTIVTVPPPTPALETPVFENSTEEVTAANTSEKIQLNENDEVYSSSENAQEEADKELVVIKTDNNSNEALKKKEAASDENKRAPVAAGAPAPQPAKENTEEAKDLATTTYKTTGKTKYNSGETSFNQGLDMYREGRYREALPYFIASEGIAEARLYSGICFYQLNRYSDAIKSLDKYIQTTKGNLNDEAWWYKALAHLKLENKEAARTALQKVIDLKGGYQQRAEELLRKI